MFGKKKTNSYSYGNYGRYGSYGSYGRYGSYGYGRYGNSYGYGYGGYGYNYAYNNQKVQETIKTLRTNIQFSGIDNPIKTICMTSTIPGEGKSTLSHFLAIEMAKAGNKTLIVECDMRRPTQGNMFRMRPKKGIIAYLAGECTLEEAAAQTQTENLYFLDVDAKVVNPVELLGSERFERAMEEMKEKFDIVIFDTLPLKMFIESAIIASHTDATVYVIRRGRVDVKSIEDSLAQLEKADARVIGAVLNDVDLEGRGYYGYYKYRRRKNTYGKYGYGGRYGYGYGYDYGYSSHKDENKEDSDKK